VTTVPLAHIAGIPVEESLQPLAIVLLLSSAWLTTRLRCPRRTERNPSNG
jgi:hypothetical protein